MIKKLRGGHDYDVVKATRSDVVEGLKDFVGIMVWQVLDIDQKDENKEFIIGTKKPSSRDSVKRSGKRKGLEKDKKKQKRSNTTRKRGKDKVSLEQGKEITGSAARHSSFKQQSKK
ncbi:hypothetical protein Tco_1384597 [Tanacetum coccineum]